MRRGDKFKHRPNIRYFIVGPILAALAFESIGIRLACPDTPELVQLNLLGSEFVNHHE